MLWTYGSGTAASWHSNTSEDRSYLKSRRIGLPKPHILRYHWQYPHLGEKAREGIRGGVAHRQDRSRASFAFRLKATIVRTSFCGSGRFPNVSKFASRSTCNSYPYPVLLHAQAWDTQTRCVNILSILRFKNVVADWRMIKDRIVPRLYSSVSLCMAQV